METIRDRNRTKLRSRIGQKRSVMYNELDFYSLKWFLSLYLRLSHDEIDVFRFLTLDVEVNALGNAVTPSNVHWWQKWCPLLLRVREAVDVHASSGGQLSGSLFVINRP